MGPSTPKPPEAGAARPPAKRGPNRPKTSAVDSDAQPSGREFVHAPSNRTNIALPFSKITLQEPSDELHELAGLLCELVEALEKSLPQGQRDGLKDLHIRAEALRLRLRSK